MTAEHHWPMKPLGELFDIGAGKTMSAAARAGVDKVPFLRTSNVFWDRLDLSNLDEMAIPPAQLAEKSLVRGDLLVCEGGDIGRAAIWDGSVESISFQNHLHRLRKKVDDVEPRFFVFFLQSAFTQLGIFEGAGNRTTIPNLSSNRLAALEVPHPSLPDQKAVVAALGAIRDAIAIHASATATATELKRAAMATAFRRGLGRDASRSDTECDVPAGWAAEPLGLHHRVATGGTPSRSNSAYWAGGTVPWVKTGEVSYNTIAATEEHVTEAAVANSGTRIYPAGTLLMAMYGQGVTRGKVAKLGIAAACNQACAAIQGDGTVEPDYLYHYLEWQYEKIRGLAHGGQQQNLNLDIVRAIPITYPVERSIQRQIADVLDSVDQKVALHQRRLSVLDELFKSLMYKLMTGEVSVDELDLTVLGSIQNVIAEEVTA